jgi:tetratricopeptide (TPR) repeat protein
MSQCCARPGCFKMGLSSCSACLREPYCGGDCQKLDWMAHKLICKILKTFSNKMKPFHEVGPIIEMTMKNKKNRDSARLLGHLISYVEFQFGNRIPGKCYRKRDGESISNYLVEVILLIPIYKAYIEVHERDTSISELVCNDLTFPYVVRTLEILKPWSIVLDSDPISIRNSLSYNTIDQVDGILKCLSHTEANIANIYRLRYQYNLAENHCQRALDYAKRYVKENEMKTKLLYFALGICSATKSNQCKYEEAASFAEECYNVAAIAFNPVHPDVQEAASKLIEALINTGNQSDAERYAEMTLDSLRNRSNGVNQESEEVAVGYYDLARTILERPDGDLDRIEQLAREAYRIRVNLKNDMDIGISGNLLANCLKAQGKLGDETIGLYTKFLGVCNRDQGPDNANASAINANLSRLYSDLALRNIDNDTRNEHLRIAKSYIEEAVRIARKVNAPGHLKTLDYEDRLDLILMLLPDA